jgi:hypothetical protein
MSGSHGKSRHVLADSAIGAPVKAGRFTGGLGIKRSYNVLAGVGWQGLCLRRREGVKEGRRELDRV